jgi:hypothetical protein
MLLVTLFVFFLFPGILRSLLSRRVLLTKGIIINTYDIGISIVVFTILIWMFRGRIIEPYQTSPAYSGKECERIDLDKRCKLKSLNNNFPTRYGMCFNNDRGKPWCYDILGYEEGKKSVDTPPPPPIVKTIQSHVKAPPLSDTAVKTIEKAANLQIPKLPPPPYDPKFTSKVRAYLGQVVDTTKDIKLTLQGFKDIATFKYESLSDQVSTDPKGRAIPDKQFFKDTYDNILLLTQARFDYYLKYRV